MDIGTTFGHQKQDIEAALLISPNDRALLQQYLQVLLELSRQSIGLIEARLPGIKDSIFLRANSSDISNFVQIFLNEEYGFDFPFAPRRILDLGGYAGYAALYLNRRFPEAEIISVEPSRENLEIFRLNTARCARIHALYGAIWNTTGAVAQFGQADEHWGHRVATKTKQVSSGIEIPAFTVQNIMDHYGWPEIDFVKCDIEGAEVELFDPLTDLSWMNGVSVFSVETHDRFRENSTASVLNALTDHEFARSTSGEFLVFTRKKLDPAKPCPPVIRLTPHNAVLHPCQRINVPDAPWGFMILDDRTFQLHPGAPLDRPTSIAFPVEFDGHSRISATVLLDHPDAQPVTFEMTLSQDGGEALKMEKTLYKPGTAKIELNFQPARTRGTITISTAMAKGTSSNGFAWARWRNLFVD